ncbi:MAG: hypothetical protein JNM10_12625 [Planctomycetia bacterium]|nr:hypothetical protein [Planctomycetia bacterium]
MTTRQTRQVLRAKFFPVLQAEGFVPDKKMDGVLATRDRGRFHDRITADVYWVRPRYVQIAVGVRSDDFDEFMAPLDPGWVAGEYAGNLSLRSFEPGADRLPPGGARKGWAFDGDEPPEALLDGVVPLLVATCKHLESVRTPDALADLFRDHNSGESLRPPYLLAGVFAFAGRCAEVKRICRAALESREAAMAENVEYSPYLRTALEAFVAYCDARA